MEQMMEMGNCKGEKVGEVAIERTTRAKSRRWDAGTILKQQNAEALKIEMVQVLD
jgi:hypothetical protein